MTIQIMTAALINDPAPLAGRIVFTYQGSPYPLRLDRLIDSYRVKEVRGKHIFVEAVDGEPCHKTRITPASIGMVCDTLDEYRLIRDTNQHYKERRADFSREFIGAMKGLCTPVQEPTEAVRVRPRQRAR